MILERGVHETESHLVQYKRHLIASRPLDVLWRQHHMLARRQRQHDVQFADTIPELHEVESDTLYVWSLVKSVIAKISLPTHSMILLTVFAEFVPQRVTQVPLDRRWHGLERKPIEISSTVPNLEAFRVLAFLIQTVFLRQLSTNLGILYKYGNCNDLAADIKLVET